MLKVLVTLVALAGITTAHAAEEKPFGERSLMSESNIAERVSRTGTVCLKGEACAGQIVKKDSSVDEVKKPETVAASAPAADAAAKPATEEKKETAAAGTPRSGETLFNTFCTTCHSAGVAGAPKFGDAAAWKQHLDAHGNDKEALWKSGWNGKNAMPPKGMCADCTEEEFSSAVFYMLDHSK